MSLQLTETFYGFQTIQTFENEDGICLNSIRLENRVSRWIKSGKDYYNYYMFDNAFMAGISFTSNFANSYDTVEEALYAYESKRRMICVEVLVPEQY